MARRKEHDEEMKTARSLVAKMEYEVVEMVMKLWRLMGHLGGKEEEEDDGGGGVVVEMEEEMVEKWLAKGGNMAQTHGNGLPCSLLVVAGNKKKKERKNE